MSKLENKVDFLQSKIDSILSFRTLQLQVERLNNEIALIKDFLDIDFKTECMVKRKRKED